ncbi:hypothetical protein JOC47_000682 [Halanaerobacter jeridensis]|uniref:Uncharacterized protein n=2 Tax=Halanaerobacter jeridensis TaxID=706427 RepID=A0A939BNU7_9FIRM|nr:hypothetical protein [Halanaerobacter jeridensis]MBM7555848.1 hypothetical protein [Halanaerobacter jeridensis]
MDDYLDQEIDRLNNRNALAVKLKRGIVPYSLLLFSFAILCNYKLAISLFWASYIVGMGINKTELPFTLKMYQEVFLLLIIAFLVLDSSQFLFALIIILFIQAVDDYIDYYREKYIARDNFINYFGRSGTFFIIIFSLVFSLNLNWQLTLLIIVFSFLINLLM